MFQTSVKTSYPSFRNFRGRKICYFLRNWCKETISGIKIIALKVLLVLFNMVNEEAIVPLISYLLIGGIAFILKLNRLYKNYFIIKQHLCHKTKGLISS
jgi:hypothetical protein